MIALRMIMGHELGQGALERAFAKQDELGEAFFLDGSHPTLRERIQIWAAGWKSQALYTFGRQ